MKQDPLDVSIIIVSYNTADLIETCLDSLGPETGLSREVFVVDNASTDEGAEMVGKAYPWVHLIINKENRGFAAANNQALQLCRGRYIYYLNPDTKIVYLDLLEKCVRYMESHPEIGLAGTRLINPDGSLQESVSWRYPGQKFAGPEMSYLKGKVACVMGASMIVRSDLIRRIGGFDEGFSLYGEDQDLCLRIRREGYEIGYIEDAVVLHYGGQSERQSLPAEIWRKKTCAEYLFYRKHYLPETITRIRRADLHKARFRLITLPLARWLFGNDPWTEGKRIKYLTIIETIKQIDRERAGYSMESADANDITKLTASGKFRFGKLHFSDIDNTPVLRINKPEMAEEEICLFYCNVEDGTGYSDILQNYVKTGMEERRAAPVVRFADGEYAFYQYTLECNGLYKQAESVEAIRKAMPMHIDALRRLAAGGMMAPLIFPGNTGVAKRRGFVSLLRFLCKRSAGEASASSFLNFLSVNGIELTGENYIPFYAVYAYLTSETFARLVDGRKVCILNADCNPAACREWFSRFASRPEIVFAEIPAEYIATRWGEMRESILERVAPDAELCLVGAGVGALPLCVDVAGRFSIPAIDAGHVLNMMNGREDKSNGARLFTIRKSAGHATSSGE